MKTKLRSLARPGSEKLLTAAQGAGWAALAGLTSLLAALAGLTFGNQIGLSDLQEWSYALGQVSFGLIAALLAIVLPNLGDFPEFWDRWRVRIAAQSPGVTDEKLDQFVALLNTDSVAELLSAGERRRLLRRLDAARDFADGERLRQLGGELSLLRRLMAQTGLWVRLLKDPHVARIFGERFRAEIIAEVYAAEIARNYAGVIVFSVALCFTTLVLGTLSLSPDPFFYGLVWSLWAQIDLDPTEVEYRMFCLILPAVAMMGWMTFFGFRVAQAYGELRRLDPAKFPSDMWHTAEASS